MADATYTLQSQDLEVHCRIPSFWKALQAMFHMFFSPKFPFYGPLGFWVRVHAKVRIRQVSVKAFPSTSVSRGKSEVVLSSPLN